MPCGRVAQRSFGDLSLSWHGCTLMHLAGELARFGKATRPAHGGTDYGVIDRSNTLIRLITPCRRRTMRGAGREEADGLPLLPPPRLFERLAKIPGFTWDPSIRPFHSVSEYPHNFAVWTKDGLRHTIIGTSLACNISIPARPMPLPLVHGATP